MVGKETHVPPGLNSIAIPTFVNQTLEPGIEVPFTQAFLREFILDRRVKVVDRKEADSILEGVIKSFNIFSVSYDRSGLVLEYQATVVADLTLKKRTGEILWMEKNFTETRWYRTSSKYPHQRIQQSCRHSTGRKVYGGTDSKSILLQFLIHVQRGSSAEWQCFLKTELASSIFSSYSLSFLPSLSGPPFSSNLSCS